MDQRSPKWLREEVYWRATALKREFGFDSVPWEIESYHDPEALGFIFHDQDYRITGACSFRPFVKGQEQMVLDWIWLCPAARRTGVVSRQWESFRERFGVFFIGGPVSEAMLDFLGQRFPDHNFVGSADVVQARLPLEQFAQA